MIYLTKMKMMEMKNLPLDILRQPLEDRVGSSLPLRSRGLFPAKKNKWSSDFNPGNNSKKSFPFIWESHLKTFGQSKSKRKPLVFQNRASIRPLNDCDIQMCIYVLLQNARIAAVVTVLRTLIR